MGQKMINVLIVNWNSHDDLNNLLDSISKSKNISFRVIVIDNNSEDIKKLRKIYNYFQSKFDIFLIENNQNLGYAVGNNIGYRYLETHSLSGDVLIINPDVLLLDDTIYEMSLAKRNHNAGAAMVRTFSACNEHLYDFIKLNGLMQRDMATNEKIIETDYAAGSCLLLDRGVINQLGLFNDKLFMYWEEVDLCFRIREIDRRIISTTKTSIKRKANDSSRNHNAIFFSIRNSFFIYSRYDFISLNNFSKYLIYNFVLVAFKALKFRDYRYFQFFFKGIKEGYSKFYSLGKSSET
jgi:GT2 family glycosyltransferase